MDKTGDVEKANQLVQQVLRRQRLEKEREKILENIKIAKKNQNDTEMEKLIHGKMFVVKFHFHVVITGG